MTKPTQTGAGIIYSLSAGLAPIGLMYFTYHLLLPGAPVDSKSLFTMVVAGGLIFAAISYTFYRQVTEWTTKGSFPSTGSLSGIVLIAFIVQAILLYIISIPSQNSTLGGIGVILVGMATIFAALFFLCVLIPIWSLSKFFISNMFIGKGE